MASFFCLQKLQTYWQFQCRLRQRLEHIWASPFFRTKTDQKRPTRRGRHRPRTTEQSDDTVPGILASFLLHSRATIAFFCTFGPPDRRLLLSSSASVFNPHITTILIPLNAECDALHLPSTLTAVPVTRIPLRLYYKQLP
ncbi:uncharacterized protein ACNLHF_011682 [Anomaloglossus baeobatrachus]